MNADTFVEECRRAWKRLRVPEQVAEEMAAELRTDLAEAAADGVPAEELLGTGAFDARGFAASWASERGVVPASSMPGRSRTQQLAGATVAAAALAVAGSILLATATTTRTPGDRLALAPPSLVPPVAITYRVVNGGAVIHTIPRSTISTGVPATTGSGRRTVGLILLPIGLLALILVAFDALRLGRRPLRAA